MSSFALGPFGEPPSRHDGFCSACSCPLVHLYCVPRTRFSAYLGAVRRTPHGCEPQARYDGYNIMPISYPIICTTFAAGHLWPQRVALLHGETGRFAGVRGPSVPDPGTGSSRQGGDMRWYWQWRQCRPRSGCYASAGGVCVEAPGSRHGHWSKLWPA